jgi:hypothetical protein
VKVGEIFIQLGFEVQGRDQASGFQSIVDSIAKSTAILTETIEDLRQEFIEQMEGTKKTAAATKKAGDETEKNTKKTKEHKVAVSQQVGELWKARLQFVGVGAAIMYATQKASAYAQSLNIFSNVTGLSSIELQKWQQAAAAAGISGDEMAATVRNLQKAKTDILLGQGSESQMRAFSLFGIGANEDPMAMLDKIKAKLGSMPRALESRMLEGMGFSDAMQSFLRESKSLPQGDNGLILNERELKRLKQFNVYFNQTMDNVKRQMYKFGVAMSPIADFMLYAFERLSKSVTFIASKFASLDDATGGRFFKLLTLGALGLAAALFPTMFAVGTFIVIVEDLITALQGGNSVIGFWLSQFKSWRDILESIPALIATIVDALTLGLFTDQITKGLQFVTGSLKTLSGDEGVAASADFASNLKSQKGTTIAGALAGDYSTLAESGLDTPVGRNSNITNNVSIQVDGAKNPAEVAKEVKFRFDNVTNNTVRQNPIAEGKPR